jgi:hypothetical protein
MVDAVETKAAIRIEVAMEDGGADGRPYIPSQVLPHGARLARGQAAYGAAPRAYNPKSARPAARCRCPLAAGGLLTADGRADGRAVVVVVCSLCGGSLVSISCSLLYLSPIAKDQDQGCAMLRDVRCVRIF